MTITLRTTNSSHPDAVLTGDTTIPLTNGWAKFEHNSITYAGKYLLDFEISSPTTAVGLFDKLTIQVEIKKRVLVATILSQPIRVTVNETFTVKLGIIDEVTRRMPQNLMWRVST